MSDLRSQYELAVQQLGESASSMLASGVSEEQVARWAVEQRSQLKLMYRNLTPRHVLATIEAWTLKRYGNTLGPSVEQLRDNGKSWGEIINSAARPGSQPESL